ncbi:MAG TPA: magnesium transporter [Gemmatimonadaceae bacterium]|nr:magnesium transporter [Gemmatimonadaceae bacterium]
MRKTKKAVRQERPIAALLAPDIIDLLKHSPADVAAETEELHPADLADIVELLPRSRVSAFLAALPGSRASSVLEYVNEKLRSVLLEELSTIEAAKLVEQMTPDDRADVLEELGEERADEILEAIPADARRETQELLAFDPDTAGGLMTTEIVSVLESETVEHALAQVRTIARSGRREAMNVVYVTDASRKLTGVISLRELLAAPEGARVTDIARSEVRSVVTSSDRAEVSRLISEYDIVAIPVVDDAGILRGMVTVDDVIDVIQEKQTEDVQRFGGLEALEDPYMESRFVDMLKKRAGWLCVLFLGEMLTASAMQYFEKEIAALVVLTLFIPLIVSSGGNSGSQATSLIIRALALGEVSLKDWWRVARRELTAGIALGVILGTIGVLRVLAWQGLGIYEYGPNYLRIAVVVGFSLLGVVMFGTLAGSMLPFILRRLGFDPASASAPFVATLVDVTGLVIYFSVALILLKGYGL